MMISRSLASSLKGVFTGFNLLPDTRKSNPSKASPVKAVHQLLFDEEESSHRSVFPRDLEGQDYRPDTDQPFFADQTQTTGPNMTLNDQETLLVENEDTPQVLNFHMIPVPECQNEDDLEEGPINPQT